MKYLIKSLILFCFLIPYGTSATVYYVNLDQPDNTGDGLSWATAKKDIQAAIDAAFENDVIWVKSGTYFPTQIPATADLTNDRDKTFYIKKNLSLFGGFAGTESSLSERDWKSNPTILSGDIGVAEDNSDNCYHIILVNNTGFLEVDGFTISDANANASSAISVPAAISRQSGGAIYSSISSMAINNCIFMHNNATGTGACLYFQTSSWDDGRREYNISTSVFQENTAPNGGILYSVRELYYEADFTFGSSSGINNCVFINNTSKSYCVYDKAEAGSFRLYSSAFVNNKLSSYGSMLNVEGYALSAYLYNNIFWNNLNSNVYLNYGKCDWSADLRNLYVRNNSFSYRFSYQGTVSGPSSSSLPGPSATYTNNLYAQNPLFIDTASPEGPDGIWLTEDDGLRLQNCSVLVDSGNGYATEGSVDISGSIRIGVIDIGPYESPEKINPDLASGKTESYLFQDTATNTYLSKCDGLIAKVRGNAAASSIKGNTTAVVWVDSVQSSSYVKRHYQITPDTGAATQTGTITLYFKQGEFDSYNSVNTVLLPSGPSDTAGKSNLLIQKYGGTSFDSSGTPTSYTGELTEINPADSQIVWNATESRWEITFNVTGFSGFFVTTISGPLPLSWIDVGVVLDNYEHAAISWKVSERNTYWYTVEKEINGEFVVIGEILSKGDGVNSYNLIDTHPFKYFDKVLYRVKSIDIDGSSSYSNVLELNKKGISNVKINLYPNPAGGSFVISGLKPAAMISVFDLYGRLMLEKKASLSAETITTESLPSGSYIVKCSIGDDTQVLKLVKK